MLATLFTFITSPVGRIAGAILAVCVAFGSGYIKGRADGRAIASKAAVEATFKQLRERGMINEDVRNSDITDICIELGGLPDECGK